LIYTWVPRRERRPAQLKSDEFAKGKTKRDVHEREGTGIKTRGRLEGIFVLRRRLLKGGQR